jgi:hypothetical protein
VERGTPLVVDNVFGSIAVRGHGGGTVAMIATETVYARSAAKLERARDEVKLEVYREDGELELFVDGPFRDRGERRDRGRRDPGYRVVYDFEILVPRDTDLTLHTVNDGDVHVSGVRGDFDVRNVNGAIRLEGVAGSGSAVTVNGTVAATFAANPEADSLFRTLNGDVDLSFQPGLSADFDLKTTHGELWSAFPVSPLAAEPPTLSEKGGRTIIRMPGDTRVRVGGGGPRLSCETMNGDISIRKREN